MKTLKGLTNKLIKASKNKNLLFSEKELENIKNSAYVYYNKLENGYYLKLWCRYNKDYSGSYYWSGEVRFDNDGGHVTIFSGFTANPIGRIERTYTITSKMDYNNAFNTILDLMKHARTSTLEAYKQYRNYAIETGNLS